MILADTNKKIDDETIKWFIKFAKSHPAFNFVVNYSKIMLSNICTLNDSPTVQYSKRFAEILNLESDRDINKDLRLVELEKDLVPLVENTDNDVFYRKLFFPSIFLNNDFHFEDLLVKGIYVSECHTEKDSNNFFLHVPENQINDYAIFTVSVDLKLGCEFYSCIALINKTIGERYTDTNEENNRMIRHAEFIRKIVCNIIDMVEGNDDDLNLVTIVTTNEQNLKRIKRGQIKLPTKVYIRAKGDLKRYISEFTKQINKPSHSFPVRGHWRHFRDSRFVNMKGEKIWIKPTIKGVGILKVKDYKVVKNL